jgi:hypothetical protein
MPPSQIVTQDGEDITDLAEAAGDGEDDDDEFSHLRKLISEGRITGLNEKPPSFVPPTPPSTSKPGKINVPRYLIWHKWNCC